MSIYLISGSRKANEPMLAYCRLVVQRIAALDAMLVVGDADGVDAAAIEEADRLRVKTMVFGAKGAMRNVSKRYGVNMITPGSYYERDEIMARIAHEGVFIWNGRSRGTQYTYDYMAGLLKPVHLYDYSKR